jgi:hypothetical protein
MIALMLLAAVRGHLASVAFTLVVLTVGGRLAGLPAWVPALGWAVAAVAALEGWYVLEPLAQRLRGARPATVDERQALGEPRLAVYVTEADAFGFDAGLRSLRVSRGALEIGEPPCLAALALHAERSVDGGRLVVEVGLAPLLGLAWLAAAIGRLGALLALAVGSALVVPFWMWGDGVVRVGGRLLGALLVLMLSCLLIASGFSIGGLGLLVGPGLSWIARRLLSWEAEQLARRVDRELAATGYGAALLGALELRQSLGEPLAPRIAALRAELTEVGHPDANTHTQREAAVSR